MIETADIPETILRPYQSEADAAFDDGRRMQFLGWHRRAGKDLYAMDKLRRVALKKKGSYWYLFPKHAQGRKAIWEGVDASTGIRILDRGFPPACRSDNIRNQDMFMELVNGSTVQFLGSDYYDRLVGAGVYGAVFSEYALCRPKAFDYVEPMLLENGGFAIFPTTFRGRNHAWQMAEAMKDEPHWYVDIRDITQTTDNDGNRIITDDQIEYIRRRKVSEAIIQEEYFCNPNSSIDGSIYGRQYDAYAVRTAA